MIDYPLSFDKIASLQPQPQIQRKDSCASRNTLQIAIFELTRRYCTLSSQLAQIHFIQSYICNPPVPKKKYACHETTKTKLERKSINLHMI